MVAQAWILYAKGALRRRDLRSSATSSPRKRDCEGAYYLLLRALFASGKYQDVANIAEEAIEASGTDYNVYVPIMNSLGALAKHEALKNVQQRAMQAMEAHVRQVPEDARARILLGGYYAEAGRAEDAMRETNLAMLLRPNEALVHYNAACTFCSMKKKAEALDAHRQGLAQRLQGRRLGPPRPRPRAAPRRSRVREALPALGPRVDPRRAHRRARRPAPCRR